MPRMYCPPPINELKLSARNQRLQRELLDAPERYSTVNAEISMESYEKTQGQPVILRRAKALADLFEKMPVYIRDGELLAGNRSEALGVMPRLPKGFAESASPRANADDSRFEAHGIFENYYARLSDDAKAAEACLLAGYPAGSVAGFGHIMADYGMIIREGALALAEKAEAQSALFAREGKAGQRDFCEASAIACRGLAAWGRRYGALARKLAADCGDTVRRGELEALADVCDRVPAYPARSFREALQAMFFAHQAMMIEQQGGSISIGGFDRVLLPHYEADTASGGLDIAFAQELVEAFYIKLMENAIWPRKVVTFCNMTVGGMNARGEDMSNDLTWIALDTTAKTGSSHPLLSFRWYPDVDLALWQRVIEVVGTGAGLPAIFSDPKMIAALESWGVSRESAVEYGVVGCVEPALNGRLHGQTLGGHLNLLLCLELALNDGRLAGEQERIGPATGSVADFSSMEDVFKAYGIQVAHACKINRESVFAAAEAQRECFGYPLMSSLMHGAVEAGRDLTNGVEYNFPTVCVTGVTNVVDSLLALRELVFDGGQYTLIQLAGALAQNYAGQDALRARILASRFRFGNGDPRFSELYNRVCDVHTNILNAQPGPRGGHFAPGLWTTTWHVVQGRFTGASLDGRLAGEPLADCAGPVSGRAVHSPTAMARDMAGIDAVRHFPGGYVFNQKFDRALFEPGEQIEKLAGYIGAFFQMGGMQMQINVHSRELLLDAQKSPELHKDLVVRVAGFSAYFTSLDTAVQNEIISRASVEV